MRKFFAQDVRTDTFKCFNYFMSRYHRIGRYKDMNMVRHNFKSNNTNLYLFGFIFNNLHKPVFNLTYENRASSFRTKYQMIIYKIYMMLAMSIFHVDNIIYINKFVKSKIQERRLAIHPLTKVRGFLFRSL